MYQYEELGRLGLGQGLLESPSEFGIEPPDFINHGGSQFSSIATISDNEDYDNNGEVGGCGFRKERLGSSLEKART